MQAHLSYYLPRIVMTKFTIENKVHGLEGIADLLDKSLNFFNSTGYRGSLRGLGCGEQLAP